MLYRQFSWADTKTILHIYITCIQPHLEYPCQLWDPYTNKDAQLLEDVQKFRLQSVSQAMEFRLSQYAMFAWPPPFDNLP